jgi:hypothetical protein
MAKEDKNQDPEQGKNPSGSDDDFGLPDFEFEALDDDDDDEIVEETPVSKPIEKTKEPVSESKEEVPSLDSDDLEGLDLEGLDDIDLDDLGDLGDLDDIDLDDLDDLDLDDLDLGDLDKELDQEEPTHKEEEAPPVAASAERVEDIFDKPREKKAEKESEVSDSFEDSDDGLFYEEESFEDFDGMVEGEGESSSIFEESGDSGDMDFDHDLFEEGEIDAMDFGTDDPDKDDAASEAVPFAKRPVEKEYQLSDTPVEEISDAEIRGSRGKFVRIVILGTLLFVSIGFAFLYFSGTLNFGGTEKPKIVAAKKKESPIVVAKTEEPKEEIATSEDTKSESAVTTPPTKKEEVKTVAKKDPPKQETKKPAETKPKTTPKTTPAKTTPVKSTPGGVTVLSSQTGQRHLIVASFTDNESAQSHARKLAGNGASPVIIPPFGGAPNYRVAVASYSTQGEALQNLDNFRQQYGNGVWILRY